jgi:hypothetical protein
LSLDGWAWNLGSSCDRYCPCHSDFRKGLEKVKDLGSKIKFAEIENLVWTFWEKTNPSMHLDALEALLPS